MTKVVKTVLVPHADSTMFALVDRVEDYPLFLPWCGGSAVLERDAVLTRARIDIDFRGLRQSFVTANRKVAPSRMFMELEEGPFSVLSGQWRFAALAQDACKVELELEYRFSNAALQQLVGPVFDYIAGTLVDRFVAQADVMQAARNAAP